jgi:hypothetical protein
MLPDDLSARTHAIGIIKELEKANKAAWAGHTMEVTRDGQVVWEIPFEMASVNPVSRRASS